MRARSRTRGWIVTANPLAQLSIGLFSLAASLSVRNLPVALIATGCYGVAALLFLPSWRYPLVCLGLTGVAAVTIVYSTWRLGGHDGPEALTAGLRIVILAWPGSVVAGYVDPARLADFLAQSLRLPPRMVAAFAAALQRFTSFGHAWVQLERARRARGFGPSANPASWFIHAASMGFAMVVHAMRGASQTAIAMDARGFASAHHRTWAEPAVWTRLDVCVLLAGFGLALVAPVAWLAVG